MEMATKNRVTMTTPATAAAEKPSEGEATNDEVGVGEGIEEEETKVVPGGKLVITVSVRCEDDVKVVTITTSPMLPLVTVVLDELSVDIGKDVLKGNVEEGDK